MLKRQPRQQPTNCLSVFEHFEGLTLKGLNLKDVSADTIYLWMNKFSISNKKRNKFQQSRWFA